MNLTRTKTIEQSIADTEESEHQLRKELGPVQLTVFGVGVIIGTGIFVLTGAAAGEKAGPAVALSFVFSGIACALAALCYAEFASTVPVAGSAYTFSYASLGELVAWIIGWDLVLELALGASTVAVGWSTYFADVMKEFGITIPGFAYGEGHNLVAAAIVLILTAVLCAGIKISSQVNFVFVVIKVSIVLLVIVAGVFFIKSGNYSPFIPPSGSEAACEGHSVAVAGPGVGARRIRDQRDLHGSGLGLLRLHRVRHRRDRCRGDQEPSAGHAHRHSRLAGDLHGALRRSFARGDRDGEVHRHQDRRSPRGGIPFGRSVRYRHRDLGRGSCRTDDGHDDSDARSEPGLLRDEPGLVAAPGLREGQPAVRHAAPHDDDRRRRRRVATFVPLTELAELVNIGTLFASCSSPLGSWCFDAPARI